MEKKKVLLFSFLFLLITFTLLGVVSAQNSVEDFFKSTWESWKFGGEGAVPYALAKVLLGVIVGLLVYTVLDFIPSLAGEGKGLIKGILAIIVAFLGTAYFGQAEVFAILVNYSATGFAISMLFPLLVMVAFSYKFIVDNTSIKNAWIKKSLLYLFWGMFGLFVIWRIIGLSSASTTIAGWVSVAHWIILGVVVLVLLFLPTIIRRVMKGEIEGIKQDVATTLDLAGEVEARQAEMAKRLSGRRK